MEIDHVTIMGSRRRRRELEEKEASNKWSKQEDEQ